MRSFVMALLGIPFSKSKIFFEYSDFQKIFIDVLDNHDIQTLYDFIYSSNEEVYVEAFSSSIINLLVKEAYEDKILISIDNIQEISKDLQILFWNVLEHCRTISII